MAENDLVSEYIRWCLNVRHLAGSTCAIYERTLRDAEVWGGSLLRLDPEEIEAFMGRHRVALRRSGVGSAATQSRDRTILNGFYKWAQARGFIASNPCALTGIPKVHNKNPKPIPDALWLRVYEAASNTDVLWLGLGAFGGLRRAELVTVRCEQWSKRDHMLRHFIRKGGGDDVLPVGEMAETLYERLGPKVVGDVPRFLRAMDTLCTHRTGLILPWVRPITPRASQRTGLPVGSPDPDGLTKRLQTVLRRSGVGANAFTPHMLRHTCATNLHRAGVPIEVASTLLNHSDIGTTMRYIKAGGGALSAWRESVGNNGQQARTDRGDAA